MAKVGLVTVLFHSDNVLEGFISSLSNQTLDDYYLYIIDNTVNKETDKLLYDLLVCYGITKYVHLRNPGNYGVAKGNNQGIELSISDGNEYTLLLNNDIEFFDSDTIESLITVAKEKKEMIVVPKIFYHNTTVIWMAGGHFIKYRGVTVHVGEGMYDAPSFDTPSHFDYAPTCFMLINNLVFGDVGLMDENYFVYYDDTDFIYRSVEKGYKIFYYPKVQVFHKVSFSTGGNESLFSIYYGARNRIYFIFKNINWRFRFITLAYVITTSVIKLFKYNNHKRKQLVKGLIDGYTLYERSKSYLKGNKTTSLK